VFIIIGVDPGKTTGIAHIAFNDSGSPFHVDYEAVPYEDSPDGDHPVDVVRELIETAIAYAEMPRVAVVAEQFVLEEGTHGVDTTALRVLGALEYLLRQSRYSGVELVYQLRTAKRLVKDRHLKSLDLYSDSPHSRDALRHIAAYVLANRPASPMAKFFAQAYPSD